jgi:AraC-like DNA-binding protein
MTEVTVTNVLAWQDAASRAFVPLLCTAPEPGFVAHLESVPLSGGVSLARVQSGPLLVERTSRLANGNDGDDILMSLQLQSTGAIQQHGRIAVLVPGTAALYEINHPYLLDQPQSGQDLIVLRIPRRHLGLKDPLVTDLCGRTIDQSVPGMAAFAGYAAGVVTGRGHMDHRARVELGHITVDLLSLALRSFAGINQGLQSDDETLLESAKGYIRQYLADPDLSVERLATVQNVSVRKLHELFAVIGETPGAYVRRRRMERATALLAARHETRQSVGSIAIACGFRDTSTFVRAFARVYQCTPTQWPPTTAALNATPTVSAH